MQHGGFDSTNDGRADSRQGERPDTAQAPRTSLGAQALPPGGDIKERVAAATERCPTSRWLMVQGLIWGLWMAGVVLLPDTAKARTVGMPPAASSSPAPAIAGRQNGNGDPASPASTTENPNVKKTATGPSLTLKPIIVEAQKRKQNVQDVGMAIDVFSGQELENLGVQSAQDVARLSPGVSLAGAFAGQQLQFNFRGVVNNDFNPIAEAPNTVYVDGDYIPSILGQNIALFDIDNVQLLKGPQGTLFGRNATGGTVLYLTRQPTFNKWQGYVDGDVGTFDSPAHAKGGRITAALGGPLNDKLAVRVAGYFRRHGGYLKNLYPLDAVGGPPGPGAGADLGDANSYGGRIILRYRPMGSLSARLIGNVFESRPSSAPYQNIPTIDVFKNVAGRPELVNVLSVAPNETRASIGPNGQDFGTDLNNNGLFGAQDAPGAEFFGRRVPGGDFFGYRDPDGSGFLTSSDFAFQHQNFNRVWGLNASVIKHFNPHVTMTYVGTFNAFDSLNFLDVDAGPVNQAANYNGQNATDWTQELRLNADYSRVHVVGGFFYFNYRNFTVDGLKFPINGVVPGSPFDLDSSSDLQTVSYSGYLHAQYNLTDQISLIMGASLARELKNDFFEQAVYPTKSSFTIKQGPKFVIGPVFGPNGPEPFTAPHDTETLWSGVARVQYRPVRDLMFWASVKRGTKPGSFNSQIAGGLGVPASAIPYSSERLYAYEAGFKSTLWGGLARFDTNFYWYNYINYQAFLFTGVSGVITNADAIYKGVETQFTVSPLAGLDIQVGGSWEQAKVKNVPLRVGGPITRTVRPTYTPKWQGIGSVSYQWPALGGALHVVMDGEYKSDATYNLRNFSGDFFNPYFILNGQLSWTSYDGRWQATFAMKNITQASAGVLGFDLASLCGCNEVSYRAPRWFGLGIKRNFSFK